MRTWRVAERTSAFIVLATDGATLLIEAPRLTNGDAALGDVVARLAPHLVFGEPGMRGGSVERCARSGADRVVIGRLSRGATNIAYLLSARVTVEIDDVLSAHLHELPSPFAYLVD